MKDLLLCVHVVVKTLNLEISRCHLADYVKELYKNVCHMCSIIFFPHSTNQIIVFWCCRPCLSSLILMELVGVGERFFESAKLNQRCRYSHYQFVVLAGWFPESGFETHCCFFIQNLITKNNVLQ